VVYIQFIFLLFYAKKAFIGQFLEKINKKVRDFLSSLSVKKKDKAPATSAS